MKVRKADLGKITFLAEGGFGKIYLADGFRLPDDLERQAYKEFTIQQAEQARSARGAVEFRAALSQGDRDELDKYCAWPRALVEDAGHICGLLMPLIPEDFFCRLADPDGRTSSKPRDTGWLITTLEQRAAAQVDVPNISLHERLMLIVQLTYAVAWLHDRGWVLGDISFKNGVFALDPPRLMLLDCDGGAPIRDLDRRQASTPFWDPPESPLVYSPGSQELQDAATDVYKLGLAILRWLAPGKGAATTRAANRLAGQLDPTEHALILRALSDDRAGRPTARDLYNHFFQLIAPADRAALPRLGPPRQIAPPLPGLRSDAPSAEDLIGTSSDADTLARLIAAAQTVPPLAIALIGEWGAGKSSVMLQIQRRIDDLAQMSRQDPEHSAFAANIRQVRFNAWDYSDDKVWAGLAERLFQELAAEPCNPPSPGEPEATEAATEAERVALGRELAAREAEERRLSDALTTADGTARPGGYLAGLSSPAYGLRVMAIAASEFGRDIRSNMPVLLSWVALATAAAAAWYLWGSLIGATVAAVVATLTPVVVIGRRLLRLHHEGSDLIGAQRRRLDARQQAVRQEIASLRERLALSDAAARLSAFLTNRAGPDAYRHYRNLLGQVRNDLAQFSVNLAQARQEWLASGKAGEPPLQRIVLYIDDLDRCPPHRVVEVLEAIHLMLALDLFVVVVAVDARWLVRSLEYHYRELFGRSGGSAGDLPAADADDSLASPADYLDKIFQIPYALTPPSPAAFASFLRALLPTSPEPEAEPTHIVSAFIDPEGNEPLPSASRSLPTQSRGPAQNQPVSPVTADPAHDLTDLRPVGLQLSRHEVDFMERLGPLLPTPRSAKRLANLYRLVRIGVPDDRLSEFAGSRSGGPYQAVQILLAILVGSPAAAPQIFEDLMEASPGSDILTVLAGTTAQDPPRQTQRNRIAAQLAAIDGHTHMQTAVGEYQRWCPQLARHSFHTRILTVRSSSIYGSQSVHARQSPVSAHGRPDSDSGPLLRAHSGVAKDGSQYDPDYIWPSNMPPMSAEPVRAHEDADRTPTTQIFYLVCDVSFSMQACLADLNDGLEGMCYAIRSEFAEDSEPQICVISFSDTAELLMPIGRLDDGPPQVLPMSGHANYGSVFRLLTGTIEQDTADLRERGYRVQHVGALFLTAGEPSDSDWQDALTETMTRIRTIDLGLSLIPFGMKDASEDLLRRLACPPGRGTWFHAKHTSFRDAFAEIVSVIRNASASASE